MVNKNLVVWATLTLVICVSGVFVYAISITEDSSQISWLLGLLVGSVVVPVVIGMFAMVGVNLKHLKESQEATRDTNATVKKLANGEMDAKIERVVRQVFKDYKGEPPSGFDYSE